MPGLTVGRPLFYCLALLGGTARMLPGCWPPKGVITGVGLPRGDCRGGGLGGLGGFGVRARRLSTLGAFVVCWLVGCFAIVVVVAVVTAVADVVVADASLVEN